MVEFMVLEFMALVGRSAEPAVELLAEVWSVVPAALRPLFVPVIELLARLLVDGYGLVVVVSIRLLFFGYVW